MKRETIGQKLSPILEEIEGTLLEFEAFKNSKPHYTQNGFRAVVKIFMSALMDKMWEMQEKENLDMTDRANMSTKAGKEIRKLIKTYTDIDTFKFYEK